LKLLAVEVRKLVRKFKSVSFGNVGRDDKNISAVDKDLNVLLDKMER